MISDAKRKSYRTDFAHRIEKQIGLPVCGHPVYVSGYTGHFRERWEVRRGGEFTISNFIKVQRELLLGRYVHVKKENGKITYALFLDGVTELVVVNTRTGWLVTVLPHVAKAQLTHQHIERIKLIAAETGGKR